MGWGVFPAKWQREAILVHWAGQDECLSLGVSALKSEGRGLKSLWERYPCSPEEGLYWAVPAGIVPCRPLEQFPSAGDTCTSLGRPRVGGLALPDPNPKGKKAESIWDVFPVGTASLTGSSTRHPFPAEHRSQGSHPRACPCRAGIPGLGKPPLSPC